MPKADDIFRRAAARNRIASIEAEKSRKPLPPVDYEAMERDEREQRLRDFEAGET